LGWFTLIPRGRLRFICDVVDELKKVLPVKNFDVLLVNTRRFAVDQQGRPILLEYDYGYSGNKRTYRVHTRVEGIVQGSTVSLGDGNETTFVGYEKRSRGGKPTYDVGLVIGVGRVKLGTYVGLGRMVEFAALARDAVVESSSFSFRGRVVEVYRFVADLGAYGLRISDGATVDVGIPGYGMEVHTYVKDVSAALLVALGKVPPPQ